MYNWIVRIRKWFRLIYEFFFILLIMDGTLCLSEKSMLGPKQLIIPGVILVVSYIARDLLSHAISLFIVHGIMAILQYYIMQDVYLGIVMILTVIGIMIDAAMYMKRGYVIKRAFDIFASLLAIIVLSPVFLIKIIAVSIGLIVHDVPLAILRIDYVHDSIPYNKAI